MTLIPSLLWLQTAPGGASQMLNFVPILLIFGIFYFLLLRPMQKQRKQQQQLLKELQNGNVVLTSGGIIGTVVSLSEDTVTLRVKPDNVKLVISRSAVSGMAPENLK
ncbi:MAG: preprotein translocase subunit YajC [Acidobacteria bacterium]|nr:preprotein translocase subunit YajC [Acidobacteriota bacterium]